MRHVRLSLEILAFSIAFLHMLRISFMAPTDSCLKVNRILYCIKLCYITVSDKHMPVRTCGESSDLRYLVHFHFMEILNAHL